MSIPVNDPWRAHLTDTANDKRNGLTDDEREFLIQKRDGIIPVNAGWGEWMAARRLKAETGR